MTQQEYDEVRAMDPAEFRAELDRRLDDPIGEFIISTFLKSERQEFRRGFTIGVAMALAFAIVLAVILR